MQHHWVCYALWTCRGELRYGVRLATTESSQVRCCTQPANFQMQAVREQEVAQKQRVDCFWSSPSRRADRPRLRQRVEGLLLVSVTHQKAAFVSCGLRLREANQASLACRVVDYTQRSRLSWLLFDGIVQLEPVRTSVATAG